MSLEDDIAPKDKMSLSPSLALLGTSEMWSIALVLSLQGTKDAPSLPEVYLLRPFLLNVHQTPGHARCTPIDFKSAEKFLSLKTSRYILVNLVL